MSYKATKCLGPREIVPSDEPIVVVIGAMAHGKVSAFNSCIKLCSFELTYFFFRTKNAGIIF